MPPRYTQMVQTGFSFSEPKYVVCKRQKRILLKIKYTMPVSLPPMIVDSVSCDQDLEITSGTSTAVTVGPIIFPVSDGNLKTKMTFSSGGQSVFTPRASVQVVTTPTATILESTTILAVQYDGPVTLTLPSGSSSIPQGMYIVDEGGFVSDTKPITVTAGSGTASGDVTITQPYSSMRVSPNPTGEWFLKQTATVVNPDGSTTQENEDGSTTITSSDGTITTESTDSSGNVTENVVSPDGTVTSTVTDTTGNTSYDIVEADGTTTVGTTETNGDYDFLTTNPDGSTYEEGKSGTLTSTETQNVDGTSNQTFQLDSGFGLGIDRDENGNITNFSFL